MAMHEQQDVANVRDDRPPLPSSRAAWIAGVLRERLITGAFQPGETDREWAVSRHSRQLSFGWTMVKNATIGTNNS